MKRYNHETIERATAALQKRQRTFRSLEKTLRVPRSTLFDWAHADMSQKAREERSHGGHVGNRLLEDWQESETAGFVFYRNMHDKNTSTERVKIQILDRFGVEVFDDWVSDWSRRHHISSQLAVRAAPSELSRDKIEAAISLLQEVRDLKLEPGKICAADKIYIKDKPTSLRQLAPVGLYPSLPPSLPFSRPSCSSLFSPH